MNKIITLGYLLLLLPPMVFMSVASYSYFSILNNYGQVPPYEDGVAVLAKQKGIPVNIFPVDWGDLLLTILFFSYLIFPVYILINYLLSKIVPSIRLPMRTAIIVICEYCIMFLLLMTFRPVNWYAGYILD